MPKIHKVNFHKQKNYKNQKLANKFKRNNISNNQKLKILIVINFVAKYLIKLIVEIETSYIFFKTNPNKIEPIFNYFYKFGG